MMEVYWLTPISLFWFTFGFVVGRVGK